MINHEAKHAADAQLRLMEVDGRLPRPGQVWRHYTGNLYVVVGTSVLEEDADLLVHYHHKSHEAGRHRRRTRRLSSWLGTVMVHGQKVPHYTLQADEQVCNLPLSEYQLTPLADLFKEPPACDTREQCLALLQQVWQAHTGNASLRAFALSRGLLYGLRAARLIHQEDVEAWLARFATCPGHEGQTWCAYHGDLTGE